MTFTNTSYQTIADVTAEVCGDYIDFGGNFFTITQSDQPGFVWVTTGTKPSGAPNRVKLRYDEVCAAIDTELIARKETRQP